MRIAQVLPTLDTGGAERHVLTLVRALCAAGDQVEVFALDGWGTLAAAFEAAGAELRTLSGRRLLQLPGAARRLRDALLAGGFDLVHSHLLRGDLVAAWAARGLLPHLRAQHNDERALFGTACGWGYRRWLAGTGPVFVPSAHVGRHLIARGGEDPGCLRVVPYGCDPVAPPSDERRRELRRAWGVGEEEFLVLILARLAPQKGQLALLRGWRRAAPGCAWVLRCVGADPLGREARRLERELARTALRERVALAAATEAPEAALGAADLLLIPSRWEGFGLVGLEALAAGTPVLASDLPALREALGSAARYFPAERPDLALRGLEELAQDPGERARLRAEGLARAASFSTRRMVEEVRRLYGELLASPSLRPRPRPPENAR